MKNLPELAAEAERQAAVPVGFNCSGKTKCETTTEEEEARDLPNCITLTTSQLLLSVIGIAVEGA